MASEAKRPKVDGDSKSDCSAKDLLQNFLSWCEKVGLTLSDKVYLSTEGTVAEYGMLARMDIEEGEVIFSIPRSALLFQGTTKVKATLEEGKVSLESASGWVPLLLALMWEYTSPESHWRPYLSLWPDFKVLDHPMFWIGEERVRLLQGTGIPEAVDKDLANIEREYSDIVLPFIRRHPDLWDPKKHTLELYKRLVAFVMAYSFQEPLLEEEEEEEEEEEGKREANCPMMVPMADMLNHVSNHGAHLEFAPDVLKMVSVRRIERGEEVFNTYGEMANWQLLHMYGFAEPYPHNSNDTADVQMSTIYKAAVQASKSKADQCLLEEKWSLLCEMEMAGETGAFIFGQTGALTASELYNTLKVLCMSGEEFEEWKENEGWEEAEEEEVDEDEKMTRALSYEAMPQLSPAWKQLIHTSAKITLDSYRTDLQADRELLEDREAYGKLRSRERYALQVRYGQKIILHKLLELTLPYHCPPQAGR